MARGLGAAALMAGLLLPAAAPASAADPLILRVGLTQSLDSLNPYQTALSSGYDAFQLTYDLLVGFGPEAEPAPGFADRWERAADGKSWTFHIREGMTWSDGTPATSADACFSFQLNLDAIAAGENIGLGYIDPGVGDAGITKAECPDDQTMILTSSDGSDRILQTYVPILPKHIWGDKTYQEITDDPFDAPLVGTGPYQVVEWKTGEFVRFVRNESYWGNQGAADEVVIQFFGSGDTLTQALKNGEVDYGRGFNADQFDGLAGVADIKQVVGTSNGWTELGFNTYGTGTGKTIDGGGPSTKALQDPAFRDALGYAIDKQELLDRIVGGYGTLGTTQIPPVLTQWHLDPPNLRTFDLPVADQKLTDAGYVKDGDGNRLDKEGKAISLRLVMPDSSDDFPKIAQFVQDWWGQLGIKVTPQVYDEGTLIDLMLPPEAGGAGNKADYDLFIWTWVGNPDPNGLLEVFRCDAIGSSSDSMWCNPHYDELYDQETAAASASERKPLLDEMQQMFYDQAPYHILFYDSNLDAYRTDVFGGWQNQPSNGTPLVAYGTLGYTLLTAVAAATPEPTAAPPSAEGSAAPAKPAPSPANGSSATSSTPLIVGAIVLVIVLAVAAVGFARGRRSATEEE
jgi:peptide/nickel transport system substrate-binding protein